MFHESEFEIKVFPGFRIGQVWKVMEEERLVSRVFYDGQIKNVEDFSNFVLTRKHVYACYYKKRLAGVFWLTHFENEKAARLHFCTCKGAKMILIDAAKYVLKYLFQHYEVLYFFIPEINILAVNYFTRLNAIVIGKIPDMALTMQGRCGMITGYFNRECLKYGPDDSKKNCAI